MKRVLCLAHCALLLCGPAYAQGKSALAPGKNKPGHGSGAAAPSRNELTSIAPPSSARGGEAPLAWIDDASLLPPGMVSFSISAMRWDGSGASEVDFPVVDAAIGVAPRLQLSASVPRVVGGADPTGAAGGVGTSFFSAKLAVYEHRMAAFKVAASPTLQVLGEGVTESAEPGRGRLRWGLPMSAEVSRGIVRLYGGGGYFSPGLWFAGAAVGAQPAARLFVSGGFARAWRGAETPGVPLAERDRKEVSGGAAYVLTPSVTLFGSMSQTVQTLMENGAGRSIVGGASFSFIAAASKP